MDILEQHREFLLIPGARVNLLPAGAPIDETSMTNDIVFSFVEWSAHARVSWLRLAAAAAAIHAESLPPITVCNADEPLVQDFMRRAGDYPLAGIGEMYWVKNVRVTAKLKGGASTVILRDVEQFVSQITGSSFDDPSELFE